MVVVIITRKGCRTVVVIITGRPAHSAVTPVLFLLSGPKMGFFPTGATRCPDKRQIWHVYRGRNMGMQPPKLSIFRIMAINLPP